MSLLLPSLHDIFPNNTEEILREALRTSNYDLEGAIEIILNPGHRTAGLFSCYFFVIQEIK